MRLSTVIVSLLFISSLTLILFVLSGHAQRTPNVNRIQNSQPRPLYRRPYNPIRDRHIQKTGLCPQNYYLNGTRPGFKFYRYHKKLETCFPIDEKGPCGKNMIFYRVGNTDYGECDCDHKKRCGRPLLYSEDTDSCWHVNTQGPCKEGQWFIYGLTQKPICQKNLCIPQERESPSIHRARKFWIAINGECMKTRTRGFCPDPDQVMFFRESEAYPQCVYLADAKVCATLNKISRPCYRGQKFDTMENCREKFGLNGSEDDH